MKKRAQASIEYLMIVGVAFMIIVPMMYIFYSYTTSTRDEIVLAKLDTIGNTIVNTAEEVFFLGPPSKSTIYYTMPDGVVDMEIKGTQRDVLVFSYGGNPAPPFDGSQQVIIPSNVPLDIDADSKDVLLSPGRKALALEAKKGTAGTFIKLLAKIS